MDGIEWLRSETNAKISHCQALKQQFRRWIKRTYVTESNQDQSVPQKLNAVMERIMLKEQKIIVTVVILNVAEEVAFPSSDKFPIYIRRDRFLVIMLLYFD